MKECRTYNTHQEEDCLRSFYAIQTSLILLLGLDPWPLDPLDPPKPQESHPNNRIKENWFTIFASCAWKFHDMPFPYRKVKFFFRTAAVVMRRDVLSGTVSVGAVFFFDWKWSSFQFPYHPWDDLHIYRSMNDEWLIFLNGFFKCR